MEHPITPPQGKFKRWVDDILNDREKVDVVLDCAWKDGYSAGADQQLKAVCKWLAQETPLPYIAALRAAMRPKPPSLAEKALDAQERLWIGSSTHDDWELIRAALERLKELEKGNE